MLQNKDRIEKIYNIHSLVKVVVDSEVTQLVAESIDFQIGHFECKKKTVSAFQILIKPYKTVFVKSYVSPILYELKNDKKFMIYPYSRLAYEKVEKGYIIYADRPNVPLIPFIQLLLVRLGWTIVHSSAVVDRKNKVVLFIGSAGSRKTTLALHLVNKYKYELLSDDLVILGRDGRCLSFPRPVAIKEIMEISDSVTPNYAKFGILKKGIFKAKRLIIENAPFVGLFRRFLFSEGVIGELVRKFTTRKYMGFLSMEEFYGKKVTKKVCVLKQAICLHTSTKGFFVKSLPANCFSDCVISQLHLDWGKALGVLFDLSVFGWENFMQYFRDMENIIGSIPCLNYWSLTIPDKADIEKIYGVLKEVL